MKKLILVIVFLLLTSTAATAQDTTPPELVLIQEWFYNSFSLIRWQPLILLAIMGIILKLIFIKRGISGERIVIARQ